MAAIAAVAEPDRDASAASPSTSKRSFPASHRQFAQGQRQPLDEIFGDEPGADAPGGVAVQPHRRRCRGKRLHVLRQQPQHHAGEDIAAARRRQIGRRVGC